MGIRKRDSARSSRAGAQAATNISIVQRAVHAQQKLPVGRAGGHIKRRRHQQGAGRRRSAYRRASSGKRISKQMQIPTLPKGVSNTVNRSPAFSVSDSRKRWRCPLCRCRTDASFHSWSVPHHPVKRRSRRYRARRPGEGGRSPPQCISR